MTMPASLLLVLLLAVSPIQAQERTTLDMTTWSIIAMDPSTGDVGVSMASCVPGSFGDGVGALVPGVGVAAVQAFWDLTNRNRVFEAIQEGLTAHQVVERVTAPEADSMTAQRQYAVITLGDGRVEIAGFTGEGAPDWSGIESDTDMVVSAQGNTLVGEAVVSDALDAFRTDDPRGRDTLADRLMRALEAGSAAGGDVRCNSDGITSTSATAMILVARGGDSPYATENIGMTDQGTDAAPWLAISHHVPLEGPNPIIEVRRRFEDWRAGLPLDG
jgi:uncharacterized Ntn-hydrolase superfamily protein